MKLVVVESPAKAKTINKYLGKDYQVLASYGHIRDLPSKDGSVSPDEDFKMVWELSSGGKKRLTDVADTEQLLRIIQSIPSPKAEPFKMWLASLGKERIEQRYNNI